MDSSSANIYLQTIAHNKTGNDTMRVPETVTFIEATGASDIQTIIQ